jgi:uncharacterized membrane protein YgdD (TMEM256/DUF423 family)
MRKYLYLASIVGVTGIAAGAFGAHALRATLIERGSLSTWNTAVLYHLVHAPALLGIGLYALERPATSAWLTRAMACWATGIALFSGSLYWLSLGGPRWLGPVTPSGGILLIAGWLCVLGGTGQSPRRPNE